MVASEVKELASQTAKATEEISAQVDGIQSATGDCVTAIGGISDTISEISGIATTIAAAVEEQVGDARNRPQRATGRRRHQRSLAQRRGRSQAADQSRTLANNVMVASGELNQQATALFESVDSFLAGLRNAA